MIHSESTVIAKLSKEPASQAGLLFQCYHNTNQPSNSLSETMNKQLGSTDVRHNWAQAHTRKAFGCSLSNSKEEPLQILYFSSIICKMGTMKQYETFHTYTHQFYYTRSSSTERMDEPVRTSHCNLWLLSPLHLLCTSVKNLASSSWKLLKHTGRLLLCPSFSSSGWTNSAVSASLQWSCCPAQASWWPSPELNQFYQHLSCTVAPKARCGIPDKV